MIVAQNARFGLSPGPTHDPDLRLDFSKGFDPDLWNDIIYW